LILNNGKGRKEKREKVYDVKGKKKAWKGEGDWQNKERGPQEKAARRGAAGWPKSFQACDG